MREKSREERFDEVFQLVLIVVALSFDILWTGGRIPIAEIAVFIYALVFWAYGNLKGGIWEYPFKLGSFNLSILLLTNFYVLSIFYDMFVHPLLEIVISALVLPAFCLALTVVIASYLKETIDLRITAYIVIGITLGYIIGIYSVMTLG
ncbi:MAG: hypothetical protein ACFFDV_12520 [Candidatus Thorarchaeota archaeon]